MNYNYLKENAYKFLEREVSNMSGVANEIRRAIENCL